MLFKRQAKNQIYDALHRGAVKVCMGLTVVSAVGVVYFGYKYYTDVRPQLKKQELKRIKDGEIMDKKELAS